MHKPIVFNRFLNEKWSCVNNHLMMTKLINVKPKVNSRCPESFSFYKARFNHTAERKTKMQQYEINKNNEILLHNLVKVFKEAHNKKKKKFSCRSFKSSQHLLPSCNKFNIIKVAQDNQFMLKRITERKPFYSINKWENDYERHLYYKRNHCLYPSIDFAQNQNWSGGHGKSHSGVMTNYSNKKTDNIDMKSRYCNTTSDIKPNNHMRTEGCFGNNEKEDISDALPRKLYHVQRDIEGLNMCNCEFSIQEMSFTLKIEPQTEAYNGYVIIFDTKEAIENIEKYYVKYDEMIDDITYDDKEDHVKFNNANKPDLICRIIRLPPKGNDDREVALSEENKNKLKNSQHKDEEELKTVADEQLKESVDGHTDKRDTNTISMQES